MPPALVSWEARAAGSDVLESCTSEALRQGGKKVIMNAHSLIKVLVGSTAQKPRPISGFSSGQLNAMCAPNMLVFLCLRQSEAFCYFVA